MEDLKRLVKVITRLKLRQSPLLDTKGVDRNSSKENIFYRYLSKGMVHTDDEASRLLYGTKSDDDRFRMLKSRLKQKLLNHLYFLDFSNIIPEHYVEEEECIKYLHQAKVLMMIGERKIARGLISKALNLAEKNELTEYVIPALEVQMRIYSQDNHPHLFEETIRKLHAARNLYEIESTAREQYYFIKMMILKSVNSRKKNLDNARNYILTLEKLWTETNSQNIFEFLLELTLITKGLKGKFLEIVRMLEEVNKGQYRNQPLNKDRLNKSYIILSLVHAYLRQWELEKGLAYASDHKDFFAPATSDWFDFHAIYFLIAIHKKDYFIANDVIRKVYNEKSFNDISDNEKQKWDLFHSYLKLAESEGHFTAQKRQAILPDVPAGIEDDGYNVAILILQFIYYLSEGDFAKVRKRRDGIKNYMANHFKETFSYRTRTFYKLLNILVEQKFDLNKVQQKCRYLLNKLTENRVVSTAHQELEIIPYEYLWEIIIDILRNLIPQNISVEVEQVWPFKKS